MFAFDGFKDWQHLTPTAGELFAKSAATLVTKTRYVPELSRHCPHCDFEFREKQYPRRVNFEGEFSDAFRTGEYDDECPECGKIIDQEEPSDEEIRSSHSRMTWGDEETTRELEQQAIERRNAQKRRREAREAAVSKEAGAWPGQAWWDTYNAAKQRAAEALPEGPDKAAALKGHGVVYGSCGHRIESCRCSIQHTPLHLDIPCDGCGKTKQAASVPAVRKDMEERGVPREAYFFTGPGEKATAFLGDWHDKEIGDLMDSIGRKHFKNYVAPDATEIGMPEWATGDIRCKTKPGDVLHDCVMHTCPTCDRSWGGCKEVDSEMGHEPKKRVSTRCKGCVNGTSVPGWENVPVPKQADFSADLEAAEAATDTDPTAAQIAAGNYRKGELQVRGLTVRIENPRGSVRNGFDEKGNPWKTTMPYAYGYITKIKKKIREGKAARIQDLEAIQDALLPEDPQAVCGLRWSWNNRVRKVAGLREFLGGYGSQTGRAHAGSDRQQQGILSGELPLGDGRTTEQKYAQSSVIDVGRGYKKPGGLGGAARNPAWDFVSTPSLWAFRERGAGKQRGAEAGYAGAQKQAMAYGWGGDSLSGGLGRGPGSAWVGNKQEAFSGVGCGAGCDHAEFEKIGADCVAVDGDKLDVFLGPDPENGGIFVIDQHIGGKYDESKVMLGFPDEASARDGYLACYTPDWKGLGAITEMDESELKAWCAGGQDEPASAWAKRRKTKQAWAAVSKQAAAVTPAAPLTGPQAQAAPKPPAQVTAGAVTHQPLQQPDAPQSPAEKPQGFWSDMVDFSLDQAPGWFAPGSRQLGWFNVASQLGRMADDKIQEWGGKPKSLAILPERGAAAQDEFRQIGDWIDAPSWLSRPIASVMGVGGQAPGEVGHWLNRIGGSDKHDINDAAYAGKVPETYDYATAEQKVRGDILSQGGDFLETKDEQGNPAVQTFADAAGNPGTVLTGDAAKAVIERGYVNPAELAGAGLAQVNQFTDWQRAPYQVGKLRISQNYSRGPKAYYDPYLAAARKAVSEQGEKLSPLHPLALREMQLANNAYDKWVVDNRIAQGWHDSAGNVNLFSGKTDGQIDSEGLSEEVVRDAWGQVRPKLVEDAAPGTQPSLENVQKTLAGVGLDDKNAAVEKRAWLPELLDSVGIKTEGPKLMDPADIVRFSYQTRMGGTSTPADMLREAKAGKPEALRNLYYGLRHGEKDYASHVDARDSRGFGGFMRRSWNTLMNDVPSNFTLKEQTGAPGSSLGRDAWGVIPGAYESYSPPQGMFALNPFSTLAEMATGGRADLWRMANGSFRAREGHGVLPYVAGMANYAGRRGAHKLLDWAGAAPDSGWRRSADRQFAFDPGDFRNDEQAVKNVWTRLIGDPSQAAKDLFDKGDTTWGRRLNASVYPAAEWALLEGRGMANAAWNKWRGGYRP